MASPLISLVIPTRERAETLRGCLAACKRIADPQVEIIVSDNFSADDTPDVVASAQKEDRRVVGVRTTRRLSMRENFEYALSQAQGDYVIYTGDDDAPVPGGIEILRSILEAYEPQAVNWWPANYNWPGAAADVDEGVLSLRLNRLRGRLVERSTADIRDAFRQGLMRSHRDGVNIYHGCISRGIIESVTKTFGGYFMDSSPDVFVTQANLFFIEKFLFVDHPITMGGVSRKSMGASTTSRGSERDRRKDNISAFISETGRDPLENIIDLSVSSVRAHVLASLVRIRNGMGPDFDRAIDFGSWADRIIEEMADLPQGEREQSLPLLREFLERAGGSWSEELSAKLLDGSRPGSPSAPSGPRVSQDVFVHFPAEAGSIEHAVELVDKTVNGLGYSGLPIRASRKSKGIAGKLSTQWHRVSTVSRIKAYSRKKRYRVIV